MEFYHPEYESEKEEEEGEGEALPTTKYIMWEPDATTVQPKATNIYTCFKWYSIPIDVYIYIYIYR